MTSRPEPLPCPYRGAPLRFPTRHGTGPRSIYDLAYLKANLVAGEGFDWYYASDANRAAQLRSPITDGAGKPWVFRYKDIKSWWLNAHYNRPAGIESPSPTAWVPQSKPFWLTEIGCPAVDKGANQPNVFIDPKSSESFLPYGSRGMRDDLVQRRYLEAVLAGFDPAHPGFLAGANPVSAVYGGRMLALDHVHVYAWDARPYPAFPENTAAWGDGANWRLGHWITGRIAGQSLAAVVAALLDDYGFTRHDSSLLEGIVTGLVIERAMSAREALSPLELAYFFDAVESGDAIRFRHRGTGAPVADVDLDALVETRPDGDLVTLTRGQETELPVACRIAYSAIESDYRQSVAASRRLVGASGHMAIAELALVMDSEQASSIADAWLFDSWAARERIGLTLPPSLLALEPSDTFLLLHAGRARPLRITAISDGIAREIEARSIDGSVYRGGPPAPRPVDPPVAPGAGPALGLFLDLPLLTGEESPQAGYVAAARLPWPGGIAFHRSLEASGFELAATATRPATTGVTIDPLPPGPEARLDYATRLRVRLDHGELTSATFIAMLSGANAAAIGNAFGAWEVLQFQSATLVAPATYELRLLLRGQAGTERAMAATVPAGARFVLLDDAVTPVANSWDQIGLPYTWRYGPSDRNLGHADYLSASHTFAGVGLRPLSPAHVRGTRSAGALMLTWVRRTRAGGDSWIASDVPLAEDSERYEVDILSGSTVVRTLATTTPAAVYGATEQVSDFGSLQAAVAVRVYQLSAFLGRGSSRDAVV